MSIVDALILAVLQGITEFLPISSSGHLILMQALIGIEEPQLLFDIILHVGTLLAVVVFFRKELKTLFGGLREGLSAFAQEKTFQSLFETEGSSLAMLIVIGTIPTGILGILIGKFLLGSSGAERLITPAIVCAILLVNGVILFANRWLIHWETRRREGPGTAWNVDWRVALMIGVAQGVAVLPGISRSGTTITTALALRIDREKAASYSFLLSIPAILGAMVMELDPSIFAGEHGSEILVIFCLGAVVAALVGYVSLIALIALLKAARFHHFAWYCWAAGLAGLVYFSV